MKDTLLENGLAVKTSLDPKLQDTATRALRNGLVNFDRRQRGWRGAVSHIDGFTGWREKLAKMPQRQAAKNGRWQWLNPCMIAKR